jgi:hypothetical protein
MDSARGDEAVGSNVDAKVKIRPDSCRSKLILSEGGRRVSAVTRHIGRNHGGKEEEGQAGEEEGEQAHHKEEEVARSSIRASARYQRRGSSGDGAAPFSSRMDRAPHTQ